MKKYQIGLCLSIVLLSSIALGSTSLAAIGTYESSPTQQEFTITDLDGEQAISEDGDGGTSPSINYDPYDGDGNDLDLNQLQIGDIILFRGGIAEVEEYAIADVVGYWHHAGIYVGNDVYVEATFDGVIYTHKSVIQTSDEAGIYRVTSSSNRAGAAAFAEEQIGKPYDTQWYNPFINGIAGGKEVYGDSYYCSEICWAAYMVSDGINLDTDAYMRDVAPVELDWTDFTKEIATSSDSTNDSSDSTTESSDSLATDTTTTDTTTTDTTTTDTTTTDTTTTDTTTTDTTTTDTTSTSLSTDSTTTTQSSCL